MYYQRSLSARLEVLQQERQRRRRVGLWGRHRQQSGWFIDGNNRVVFVQDGKLPRKARRPPMVRT
jgi:hypothetical protein